MGGGGRCDLRNRAAFLVLLYSTALFAQTVRVPFVGCESIGQAERVPAPKGVDTAVQIKGSAAKSLAYYAEGFRGTGVLAPRGWHCIGSYGSSGSDLLVAPRSVGPEDFSRNREIKGPAIELLYISADNGSGRFEMAQVLARVFPSQRAFVKEVMDSLDQPSRSFTFGPYPNDKLIVQTDRLVEYRTPPYAEGLGSTNTRLNANDDPIDCVVIWDGPKPRLLPYLLILRVRLPREQRGLTSTIIHQLEREHR